MRTARSRAAAAVLGVGLVALVPAAAQARTKSVTMGEPASVANKFEQKLGSDVNAFFPERIKVHVGDKVRFAPAGFHTVNFPAKGQDPAPLVAPAGLITGVNDAAGQPFWFNGRDNLQFNPALFASKFGKTVTLKPSKGTLSGLPLAQRPKPFTVKFTKAGTFTYFCNIHPGMKATVAVLKKNRPIPSAKQDRALVKKEINRDIKIAKKLPKVNVPAGTVSVGSSGPHGVDFYGMVPANITVSVGNTLNFRMPTVSREDHTATFGPGNPMTEPNSYLGQISASFQGAQLDQRGVYPSEPPGEPPATLTPAHHGNGFWNTGVMDQSSATPLPASNSVTFGAPGKYDYYCLIHPFMHGTVTVVP